MGLISRRKFGKSIFSGMVAAGTLANGFSSNAGELKRGNGGVRRLRISPNHRYLEYENGNPFFYLGDKAWALLHRLKREEAERYLANRAQKEFTVIQSVILSQAGNLKSPNAYGDLPLVDRDPTRPVEAYFRQVDFVVNKAEEFGLFIGMLPTWGNYWASGNSIFTPSTARQYGRFLGRRYKERPIIWILGGDRTVTNSQEREILDSLAAGLKEGEGGDRLITFHPRGPGDSSFNLNDAPWLDFNMFQSSHGARDLDNGLYVEHDYSLTPQKPTLDGENRYECLPVGFYFRGIRGIDRFDDVDVRQAAYWSLLAGACGYTYGNNNVFQMFDPARVGTKTQNRSGGPTARGGRPLAEDPYLGAKGGGLGANIPWYDALDSPGAFQMTHVRRLFESVPFTKLVPDQSMIVDGPTTGGAKIRAAKSSDCSFAIVYSPFGESFTLNKNVIKGRRLREIWYDPRYGVSYQVHETDAWGFQRYTPVTNGRANDWVLLLEDVAAPYALPNPTPSKSIG
jgi:Protein of unknown function (DUF4038)/Putative collagen-binding domain of a collagenase